MRGRLLAAGMAAALLVLAMNQWVVRSEKGRVFTQVSVLPKNDVGLVLGCSKWLASGNPNPHFQSRMDAAAQLYHSGKVKHLLLSGDNHRVGYDEPTDMKESLLARGVPAEAMTLDYAGFRTLDSVVRAREVFGCTRLTIITEDFHAHRAVFLARHEGLDAVGYCSPVVDVRRSFRTRIREVGARVKAVADLYVLHTRPKFLGEKIGIETGSDAKQQTHRMASGSLCHQPVKTV